MDGPKSVSDHAVSFEIRGNDASIADRKKSICEKTLKHLKIDFAKVSETVVCLIDDQDYLDLHQQIGKANRGLFSPVRSQGLANLIPHYFWNSVIRRDNQPCELMEFFDCLIYVHGSTASSEVGLTLTLAHELQHFVQYSSNRSTWAVHKLLTELQPLCSDAFTKWVDFPIEREARVVVKRIAVEMHGQNTVESHIKRKIDERISDADVVDWKFLLSAESDVPYDAVEATKLLVRRYRPQLTALQAQDWNDCPEVMSLDLAAQQWQ